MSLVVCALVLVMLSARALPAAGPLQTLMGSGNQQESIRAIPFDELKEDVRGKLWDVVQNPTIYRRLPVKVIDCDPEMYLFLVRYPEIIVNIWELMDVTRVQVQRTGPFTFQASDGAGTVSTAELVYGTRTLHVVYAEGHYKGPLVKDLLKGRAVLLLHSGYTETDQRTYVTNRLDLFLQLDHPAAEVVAKTLQPLIGKTIDHNFAESAGFLGKVSRVAETNGAGLQQLATRLESVQPDVRTKFSDVAAAVNHKAALRASADQPEHDVAQLLEHTVPVPTAKDDKVAR